MPTLQWTGKDQVIRHHLEVPVKILNKINDLSFKSKDLDESHRTENKIIQGDNLEVLKALMPEYRNKIKCIYIDPPYNTGNESWVYNDNVNDPKIQQWLNKVVDKDDLNRHSKWLCMMYPRLKLMRELLSDDGVIFISIDDNEQANLKLICDEIFGIKNHITTFAWVNSVADELDDDSVFSGSQLGHIKESFEYVLAYSKFQNFKILPDFPTSEYIEKLITNGGNKINKLILPKGIKCIKNISKIIKGRVGGNKDYYDILTEDGMIIKDGILQNNVEIEGPLRNPEMLKKFFNKEEVIDRKGQILIDVFLSELGMLNTRKIRKGNTPSTVLVGKGTTKQATTMLENMFNSKVFNYAKPVELIKYLITKATNDQNCIILDAFAGSGTTAHAVLNLNQEDNGNRKFILIEMQEYANSITAERVRRVMTQKFTPPPRKIPIKSTTYL